MKKILMLFAIISMVSCFNSSEKKSISNDSNISKENLKQEIIVYKNPSCGCCTMWIKHMRKNGFNLIEKEVNNLSEIKDSLGVPKESRSCHTAVMGKHIFEGHVPAESVKAFLKDTKGKVGLVVPDMPMGSPGMDMGHQKESYVVYSFDKEGKTKFYKQY